MLRCNSAETFGGSAEPSGVCSVVTRSAAPRLRGGRPAQGWFEIANAQPGEGPLHSVDDARAFPDPGSAVGQLRVWIIGQPDEADEVQRPADDARQRRPVTELDVGGEPAQRVADGLRAVRDRG